MKLLLACATLALAGCVSFPANPSEMTPEQLREWVKDRNANIVCTVGNTPYGKFTVVYLALDKGVVTSGAVSIDDACKLTITNVPKATP